MFQQSCWQRYEQEIQPATQLYDYLLAAAAGNLWPVFAGHIQRRAADFFPLASGW